MRYISLSLLFAALALCSTSCRQDVTEIRSDSIRYMSNAHKDLQVIYAEVQHFVAHEVNRTSAMPADFERFIDWRKKEWWNLQEELAYHIHYDWVIVEKLVRDIARYHGYEIKNFPRTSKNILTFLHTQTNVAWKNLVMDVIIWVEFNTAEHPKMLSWIQSQYRLMQWETNNIITDFNMFLQWRDEAYAMRAEYSDFLSREIDLVNDFKNDLGRLRILTMVNTGNLVVDFKYFLINSTVEEIPRLYDDVQRYARRVPGNLHRANDALKRYTATNMQDFDKLYARLASYKKHQVSELKHALNRANRFFDFYEREYAPLQEDVKRWWRYNILEGKVLVDELKNFYHEELYAAYELRSETGRFVSYSKKEWQHLKEGWSRFIGTERGTAYGSAAISIPGDISGPRIFGDLPIYEQTD